MKIIDLLVLCSEAKADASFESDIWLPITLNIKIAAIFGTILS
jgi:hypothetical protein